MSAYIAWKYLHILLFVYWLGADLGVFLLARAVKRPELTFDQRALLLRMAMVIDQTPRFAFVLMFPAGFELANALGVLQPSPAMRLLVWGVAAGWLALVVGIVRAEGSPKAARLMQANLRVQMLLLVVLLAAGLASLLGHGPFPAGWMAWKVLLFGLIFLCAIMIDREFAPLMPAFARLASEGSTPEVERAIAGPIDGAVRWVLALYGLLLLLAWIGVAKPG